MAGLLDFLGGLGGGLGGILGGPFAPQQQQYTPQQQQPQYQTMPTLTVQGDPNRLGAAFQNFGHAHSLAGALTDAFTGLTTGQRTDPVGLYQQAANQTYQALLGAGFPDAQARLGAIDPEYQKTLVANPTFTKIGSGPLGDQYGFVNPRTQTVTPAEGAGGVGSGFLASGNKQYDPNLSGEQYLAQFSPEVKAAAKAYMNGDVMPTGNARNQNIASLAKTVAQKYAQDVGMPDVNDERYNAKRKMLQDLAASGNTTTGGILANGKSAFQHLANASGKLVDLGNASGGNFPGSGTLATAENIAKNEYFPTGPQKGAIAAANDNLLKYGQEATKFYAGSGGGEGERLAALKAMNPTRVTGYEAASYLQTEKELMLERLTQKENQIRDTLGQQYLDAHPVRDTTFQQAVAKIDANISKLRGEGATPTATASAAPAAAPATAQAPTRTPNAQAIQALKANPARAAEFDAYYGAGSSKKALAGG